MHGPRHDPVALEVAKGDREYAPADAVDGPLELSEAARSMPEIAQDKERPLVSDDVEHLTGLAAVGRGHGYLQGTAAPQGALLPGTYGRTSMVPVLNDTNER